jgi:hypothetical protein
MKNAVFLPIILLTLISTSVASAAAFTFSGNITNHNDIVRIDFSLAQGATDATNVRVWTDSFLAPTPTDLGINFDPIISLWDTTTGNFIDNYDDDPTIESGQTYYNINGIQAAADSGFSLSTLAAGDYFVTVAAYDNFAAGSNISDGFTYDGQIPVPIGEWVVPDVPPTNLGGSFWRVNLDGVDTASTASAVPLPGAIWLFGSVFVSLVSFGRKKGCKLKGGIQP